MLVISKFHLCIFGIKQVHRQLMNTRIEIHVILAPYNHYAIADTYITYICHIGCKQHLWAAHLQVMLITCFSQFVCILDVLEYFSAFTWFLSVLIICVGYRFLFLIPSSSCYLLTFTST